MTTQRYTSAVPTPPRISLRHIPRGALGTQQTVEHVQALIRAGAKDFYVRQKSIDILLEKHITPKDYLAEIKALFEWVQQHIRYTKDTFQVEMLHSARRMLELRAGDCDDMAILLGAMLEAIGHPVRLVIIGPDPLRQDLFTHIYLEVFHKGRWIPLDATMPYPMGWGPRAWVRKVITIERRPTMMSEDLELHDIGAEVEVPKWLHGLIQAIRSEAMQPKDERVKSLWNLLRERHELSTHPWLKEVLQRIWTKGLAARPRPLTTEKLVTRLRHIGILSSAGAGTAVHRPGAGRPGAPMAMRPVRVVAVRPVGPHR
ncbi:MAG TPA: transglutaminase-like domain-containing protein [Nitrospiraceae bacterium]|nr:transglutaminase-like domain-containing protein [Nitrospiraceae bacterium]